MAITSMFQALSWSKLVLLSLFRQRGGMLVKQNFRGVLCVDLWAGKHITITDLMELNISKNCFRIVKAGALWEFNNIFRFIQFCGLSCLAKSCTSLKSAFFGMTTKGTKTFSGFTFLLNVRPWITGFQDSDIVFGNIKFHKEVGHLLLYVCPTPSKPLLYLVLPTLPLLIKTDSDQQNFIMIMLET